MKLASLLDMDFSPTEKRNNFDADERQGNEKKNQFPFIRILHLLDVKLTNLFCLQLERICILKQAMFHGFLQFAFQLTNYSFQHRLTVRQYQALKSVQTLRHLEYPQIRLHPKLVQSQRHLKQVQRQ